jgi:hypothetical protein
MEYFSMKNYVISGEFAQILLNYLSTQPYREVFEYIKGLQSLQLVAPKADNKLDVKGQKKEILNEVRE